MVSKGLPMKPSRQAQYHDELNLARLNVILATNRTKLQHWQKKLQLDAFGEIAIECTAANGHVVPHGLDNDVLMGLITGAVLQNVEPGGEIRLTASELVRLSGLPYCERVFHRLEDSLERLQWTALKISEAWLDEGKQHARSVKLSIVSKHWVENVEDAAVKNPGQWQGVTKLVIRLDPELTRSIRIGYIRPLNSAILGQIKQPMGRSVYRALSLLRTTSTANGPIPLRMELPLVAWADHLGLTHHLPTLNRMQKIQRALEPAHTALQSAGYLKDIEYSGRGDDKTVSYTFAAAEMQPVNPEVAQLLKPHLGEQRAIQLATELTSDHVRKVLAQFERLLQTDYSRKVRSRPGLLHDMLISPEKYNSVTGLPEKPSARQPVRELMPINDVMPTPNEAAFEMTFKVLSKDWKEANIRQFKPRMWELYKGGHITISALSRQLADLEPSMVAAQLDRWEEAI
ncbi:replication initiator protein A [Deinococcus sp. 6YEL10]|uniref:replication initiator protein A n=1 Tax=Deinococcus sp. 6YEL10 TaxID=2745870 RepID=UPI001E5A0949|nr:replication initiator protein A [Deinococcus sp. 6YEL10]MCD0159907.1 replication initiator protein A [Deinococcus sp. 6YEL10]